MSINRPALGLFIS